MGCTTYWSDALHSKPRHHVLTHFHRPRRCCLEPHEQLAQTVASTFITSSMLAHTAGAFVLQHHAE